MFTALRIVPSSSAARIDCAISMPNALLRFRGRCAEMRRKNKIGRTAQWRIGRQRFNFENVQRRAGDLAISQCLRQRRFVNQTAASAIDDADAASWFSLTARHQECGVSQR